MIKLIKFQWKVFLKSIILPVLFLAPVIYHINYIASDFFERQAGFLDGMQSVMMWVNKIYLNGVLIYIIFIFVAYEFFYKLKSCNGYETLDSAKGVIKTYLAKMAVFSSVLAVFTAVMYFFSIYIYFNFSGDLSQYFLVELENWLLTFFVPGIVAMFIGAMLAERFNRIKGYMVLALIAFFSTTASEGLLLIPYLGGVVAKLMDLSAVATNAGEYGTMFFHGVYFLAAENYRWLLALLWIVVTILIILFSRYKKFDTRKTITVVVLFGCILLLANPIIINPAAVRSGTNRMDVVMDDIGYAMFSLERFDSDADFSVTSYDIDLNITDRLNAEVIMEVSKPLEEYRFTLSFSYNVSTVTDGDGRRLDFEKAGNYLYVYPDGDIETIVVKYSGFSRNMYSNDHAVYLLGGFAYYPIPGEYPILYEGVTMFKPIPLSEMIDFRVAISGGPKIHTNLTKLDGGVYTGTTQAVTIVGGPYCEEVVIDGLLHIDISQIGVLESLDEQQINQIISELTAGIDTDIPPFNFENYKLFYTFNREQTVLEAMFSDHAFSASPYDSEQEIAYSYLIGNISCTQAKAEAIRGLKSFLSNIAFGEIDVASLYGEEKLGYKIKAIAEANGDKFAINALLEYMYDDSDTRPYYIFVDDLFREYALDYSIELFEQNILDMEGQPQEPEEPLENEE